MTRYILPIFVLLSLCPLLRAQDAVTPPDDKPTIDIVFCIDCSGSMGPVIEAAKAKVWAIVNETARAKPSPVLRIGLLGYGDSDRTFRQFDLSSDLDEVYKNLMKFKDEGWGSEYVGLSIQKATQEMRWAEGKQVLKVIYVIGNETAKQGPTDYTKTAPEAIKSGIMVNAIYCGDVDYQTAPATWKEFARLADGQYMEIAATGGVRIVATPFDKKLEELNGRLNDTYVGYGAKGAEGAANQAAGDVAANAVGGASVVAERAAAKSSLQYNNAKWDLVDAAKDKSVELDKLKEEELPTTMKTMTPEERKAFIEEKAKQRQAVQDEIKQVATQREAFLKEQAPAGAKALDAAILKSLRDQAEKKGYKFEEEKK